MNKKAKEQLNQLSDKALLVAVKIRTAKTKEQLFLIGPDLYSLTLETLDLLNTNEVDFINTFSNQIIPVEKEKR
jgi:hypothetical protein